METQRTLPHRVSFIVLAVAAALLLSGCPGPDPAYCDCPNLIRTASSIDWMGDGSPPSQVTDAGGSSLQVILYYASSDPYAKQQQVEDRLKSFPDVFKIGQDPQGSATFGSDKWSVYVGGAKLDESTYAVSIFVETPDDQHAAEVLAPIVEVLGTIPPQ